ncbi:hypothetical protein ACVBEJ_08630 [Porticoccus sp. GXU_MW_L64]
MIKNYRLIMFGENKMSSYPPSLDERIKNNGKYLGDLLKISAIIVASIAALYLILPVEFFQISIFKSISSIIPGVEVWAKGSKYEDMMRLVWISISISGPLIIVRFSVLFNPVPPKLEDGLFGRLILVIFLLTMNFLTAEAIYFGSIFGELLYQDDIGYVLPEKVYRESLMGALMYSWAIFSTLCISWTFLLHALSLVFKIKRI